MNTYDEFLIHVFAYICRRFFRVIDIFEVNGEIVGMVMGDTYVDTEKLKEIIEKKMSNR